MPQNLNHLMRSPSELLSATVCEVHAQSDVTVHVIAPVGIGVKVEVIICPQRVHSDEARERVASW